MANQDVNIQIATMRQAMHDLFHATRESILQMSPDLVSKEEATRVGLSVVAAVGSDTLKDLKAEFLTTEPTKEPTNG